MQILVDADACPVKQIIVRLAKQKNIPVTMLIDTSHELNDGYSTVVTVDKQADSIDLTPMPKKIDLTPMPTPMPFPSGKKHFLTWQAEKIAGHNENY